VQDTARLTEAFRRAVLRRFVRLDLFDEDQAAGMLTWPHCTRRRWSRGSDRAVCSADTRPKYVRRKLDRNMFGGYSMDHD